MIAFFRRLYRWFRDSRKPDEPEAQPAPAPTPAPTPDLSPRPYPPATPTPQAEPHVEGAGRIEIPAIAYGAAYGYETVGAEGKTAVRSNAAEGRVDYRIRVATPGRWQVQLLTYARHHLDNGLRLLLDGGVVSAPQGHPLAGTSDVYLLKNGWNWLPRWQRGHSHQGPVTIDLAPGEFTLSIQTYKRQFPLIAHIVLEVTP